MRDVFNALHLGDFLPARNHFAHVIYHLSRVICIQARAAAIPLDLRFQYGAFALYAKATMTDRLRPQQGIANTKQALIA